MNQPEELNHLEEVSPELERELTQALRHVTPPEGFATRTLARLDPASARPQPEAPARAKGITMPSRAPLWATGAIAAALLAGVFLTEQTHIRRERQNEKTQVAQEQFEAGIRITDNTLEHVRQQLRQAGVQLGD